METKQKLTNGFKHHKSLSSSEKKCNKCGFVTFSLHVLYSHQHKCRGTLLGSMICCHCKRKFHRQLLFQQHKRTCLKSLRKRKASQRNFIKSRLKSNSVIVKKGNGSQQKSSAKPSTIACPTCMKLFPSKSEYNVHAEKGSCKSKPLIEKRSSSARKSLSKVGAETKMTRNSNGGPSNSESQQGRNVVSIDLLPQEVEKSDLELGVSCKWCKNVYPDEQILLKHLERNSRCAMAYHKQNSQRQEPTLYHTARKSMQHSARKSFPNHKHISPRFNSTPYPTSGSARKSLPNSSRNRFRTNPMSPSPLKSLNQCPVCYQKIPDPFKFFQHQKKLNHWGKATKSMNKICKCPFCGKQFLHVRSFNAHIRNHSDISEKELQFFLKKTTCDICSQIFATETAKCQHMRICHSKSGLDSSFKKLDSSKYALLPLVIKQKLRLHPNTCPICAKEFPATFFRNRHFQETHLDAELDCKFCSEKHNSIDSLENHMQEAHYDIFHFECLLCKINLATAPHVVLHCTKVHSNQDPKNIIRRRKDESVVEAPGFEYSREGRPSEVEDHDAKDGFYCDACNTSFLNKAGLTSHRQSKFHKDNVVKNLDTMRQTISDLPSPKRVPKVTKKTPEILTCTECFEDFSSIKDFVPHRLSHFGRGKYLKINDLNKYTCEICGEVSNSHSKVQMHLFWHLQVESTATETAKDKARSDLPDRLSGQQVARKSFSKSSNSQQEIVIGGVKKSLFTCEKCNIGFTTQAHYSLHVRKLCKKKASAETTKERDAEVSAGSSRMAKGNTSVEKRDVKYCAACNTLYGSSATKVHSEFCEKCTQDTSKVKKTVIERIKSDMTRQRVVAACVTCSQLFGNPKAFSEHMLGRHKSLETSVSEEDSDEIAEEFKNTILCTTCSCLFLSSLVQENHETFCKNASYHNFDEESSKEILKPFAALRGAIAICISCSVVFNNIRTLKKHVFQHNSKTSQGSQRKGVKKKSTLSNGPKSIDKVVESGEDSINKTANLESDEDSTNKSLELGEDSTNKTFTSTASLSQDSLNAPGSSAQKSFDNSSSVSNDSSIITDQLAHSTLSISHENDDSPEDPIAILRENFSQLFCILINDAELMEQLGYEEQPVDDVLINVLQQMGQSPNLKEDEDSDIDCFRKNIKIFLDFCLKDQVMKLIESGKTSVDDIVVEALKTFTSEEANAIKDME